MRLFHISEEPGIALFEPRPSPSYFEAITGDVVFAISETLLHNYLLPRECPRVSFYPTDATTTEDRNRFMGDTKANHVVVVENSWRQRIAETMLHSYEFDPQGFVLVDACAGYYVSYDRVKPIDQTIIHDAVTAVTSRNVELRFMPSLITLADAVRKSTLNFSLIRMRNAVDY